MFVRVSRFFSDRYAYRVQPGLLIRAGCLWDDCVCSRLANHFGRSRDGRGTEITKQISGYASPTPYIRRPAETDSDDLRIQHPEWVQPNGESPMCDSYEARLMKTLDVLKRQRPSTLTIAIALVRLLFTRRQESRSVVLRLRRGWYYMVNYSPSSSCCGDLINTFVMSPPSGPSGALKRYKVMRTSSARPGLRNFSGNGYVKASSLRT